jgi:hypothetical protein
MEKTIAKNDTSFKVTSHWGDQSKALKSKYTQLTDTDLKCVPGKEDELVKRLSEKLKMSSHEVLNILKNGETAKAKTH